MHGLDNLNVTTWNLLIVMNIEVKQPVTNMSIINLVGASVIKKDIFSLIFSCHDL
jgi:hypothetical protein